MQALADIVKREAQQALSDCKSEEERREVCAQVRSAIEELRGVMNEKSGAILALQEQKAAEGGRGGAHPCGKPVADDSKRAHGA